LKAFFQATAAVLLFSSAASAEQVELDIRSADSKARFSQAAREVKGLTRLSRLAGQRGIHAFQPSRRLRSDKVDSVSFQHFYKNVPVLGSRVFHHVGRESQVDDSVAVFDLDARPALSAEEAVGIASAARGGQRLSAAPELKIMPDQDATSARLVYWVKLDGASNLEPRLVIIDAHSGEVMADVSSRMTLAAVDVYDAKDQGIEIDLSTITSAEDLEKYNGYCQVVYDSSTDEMEMKDPIAIHPNRCAKVIANGEIVGSADGAARQAARNARTVLEYYAKVHKRNGIDGKGSRTKSVVHIGTNFSNAFWDPEGEYMGYGDGDGVEFGDFTQALDAVGHEMTHGVISATSNLNGLGEPGALNEATADFFGTMIENENWLIGEKIFLNGGAFRNPPDPHTITYSVYNSQGKKIAEKPFPAHLSEAEDYGVPNCSERNDKCWVHVNSTIWSHGLYRVYKAIGRAAAEELVYLTSTQYFSENTGYRGASKAGRKIRQACKQLYGANDIDGVCGKVEAAMAAVGL
jgi:bacillolysin